MKITKSTRILDGNKPVNFITLIVLVFVTTYQHVNYIKDCLDGDLILKATFPN